MREETATSSGLPGWRAAAVLLAVGGAGVMLLRWQDARALTPAPADPLTRPAVELWPEALDRSAKVATEVRALKLVAVEVRTKVTSTSGDTSLMGDVTATVTAPVRLMYGVDLGSLDAKAITFSPIHGMYLVTVPAPSRIAAEVLGQFEEAEVKTGWMRKRATEGEYHLGLARRDLSLKAQQAAPDAEQATRIREGTREQVGELVKKVVGSGAKVAVRFADEVDR